YSLNDLDARIIACRMDAEQPTTGAKCLGEGGQNAARFEFGRCTQTEGLARQDKVVIAIGVSLAGNSLIEQEPAVLAVNNDGSWRFRDHASGLSVDPGFPV